MNQKTLKTLEFGFVRQQLCEFAVSQYTKNAVLALCPEPSLNLSRTLLEITAEAYALSYKYLLSPVVQFDDLTETLAKAKAEAMLSMSELLKVARLIKSARIAKKEISGAGDDIAHLKKTVSALVIETMLEKEIGDCIAGENEMKDDASDTLRQIRRKISLANNKLKEKLNSYKSSSNAKYLQDNIVTVRGGRFVLPVKSECRGAIPGLIHDQSASGSTVFIEPFPVVELNNELKSLQLDEIREIERILTVLSQNTAMCADNLARLQTACAFIDLAFAKMAYSVSLNAVMPQLNDRGVTLLEEARHPLIDKEKVVPVSLQVGGEYDILLITGPNTGGKTVCLKTMGLMCAMAYCGIFVPCKKAEIAFYEDIFCDIGDEQSISQSLSTFSSHMVNMVRITDNITKNCLVLLDEIGAGTDPAEGAALSVGIVKYLELMKVKGIITTHYTALKEYALLSPSLMNACMQFDESTLKPTYKLITGLPGVSNAIKIAGTLGLNDYILTRARDSLSKEHVRFENVLSAAEQTKSEAVRELERLKGEKAEVETLRLKLEAENARLEERLEKINANARLETKKIVAKSVEQAEEILDEIKGLVKKADERALFKARSLKRALKDIEYAANDEPAGIITAPLDENALFEGMPVVVNSLKTRGVLCELPDKKGEAKVMVGAVGMRVNIRDLSAELAREKKPVSVKPAPKKSAEISLSNAGEPAPRECEIKVLGQTVAEAITLVEPFIASLAGSGAVVRIVHGKGTGALGKGLQAYLKTNPSVRSFRYGRYGEGETGVTIAELK